jgi:hypothetical protein
MNPIVPAFIAVLLVASPVLAQTTSGYVIPNARAPRDPLPRFTIAPRGGFLAPIGLPLPQIGLRPPLRVNERFDGRHGPRFYPWPMMVFYVPQPIATPSAPAVPEPKLELPSPMQGRLVLDVWPASAQVFADGYYVGVPADFSGERGGGILEAGIHRIDLSAPGYEPITVDLRVTSGRALTYRAALKALPPPAAAPPSTFYLIPGCYMGNIPPKDAHLPATCDQSRTVTWRP